MAAPRWVGAVLDWPGIWPVARLVLASAYLLGGVVKLLDFPGAIAAQEHFGLYPGTVWAALSILVELGGSALVISGRFVWLGAGAPFQGLCRLGRAGRCRQALAEAHRDLEVRLRQRLQRPWPRPCRRLDLEAADRRPQGFLWRARLLLLGRVRRMMS